MKKVILFDFFGVISSEIAPIWFRRYFSEEEAKRIKEQVVAPADLGKRSEDEMFTLAALSCGVDKETVKRDWYGLAKINFELVDFIKKAKKKYPVYLLSNAQDTFLKTIIYKNKLEDLFEKTFISGEIGLAKPDVNYFKYCLSAIGKDPAECVMIDDNPNNIAAAKEVGIDGIVFSNNESFYEKFNEYFD